MSEIIEEIEIGCGNVYKDIGNPEPELMKHKADLVHEISEIIKQKSLTRENAAEIISLSVSELSELLRGLFRSIDESKLMGYIDKLQHLHSSQKSEE